MHVLAARRPGLSGKQRLLWLLVAVLFSALTCREQSEALAASRFVQQGAKLTGGAQSTEGNFGRDVALSSEGSTALIGAPHADGEVGAVSVLTRTGSTWTQQAKLTGATEEIGEGHFGHCVAISADGDTAVIGALNDNHSLGAVWVFTRTGSTWTQQGPKLTGGEEKGGGRFGASVALSADGETALIGGSGDRGGFGAAWVFTRTGSTWTQQGAKLTGGEESGAGLFGGSVALSADGETALIAGPRDKNYVGAAWVFTRSGSTWTQQGAKLTGGEELGAGRFGRSVAISADGETALIGGRQDDGGVGAAWVFTRSGSTWTQQGTKVTATAGEVGVGEFGYSLALSADGDTALIGGTRDSVYVGAAWVFARSGSTWTQQGEKITGGEEQGDGWFGSSVALSSNGEIALIGGVEDSAGTGAAWAFEMRETSGPPPAGSSPATSGSTGTDEGKRGVLAFGPETVTGPGTCKVSLVSRTVPVRSGKWAALRLNSRGSGTCRGRLSLVTHALLATTAKGKKQKKGLSRAVASTTFSLRAGKDAVIGLELNRAGRLLLAAHHGQLALSLEIFTSSPTTKHTQTVHLERPRARKSIKRR
jgi:hypothetical protein